MAEKETTTKTESTAKVESAGDSSAKAESAGDSSAKAESAGESSAKSEPKTDGEDKAKGGSSDTGRGERQKVVSDSYRDNWNDIFDKKRRRPRKI